VPPGARLHARFRGKSLAIVRAGRLPPREGVHIYIFPIDAPHLALKARPAYSKEGFPLLDTRPHGAIDAPQWLSTPLALHAHVPRGERSIDLVIGEASSDPVLVIPDLLLHLAGRAQGRRVVSSEQLDPIFGAPSMHVHAEGASATESMLKLLGARGLDARDLVDGEWTLVPAAKPLLIGVDGGLLAAYGQSHRTFAFVAHSAFVSDSPTPTHTHVLFFLGHDRHRFRSDTGSFFVDKVLGRLLGNDPRAIARSTAIVASPTGGTLGRGVVLNANHEESAPETRRALLDLFARARVPFQIVEGNAPTSARHISSLGPLAIDLSIPVAGPGRPLEVTALFDLLSASRAFRALFAR
jgi:aspartyl aminopeptidase